MHLAIGQIPNFQYRTSMIGFFNFIYKRFDQILSATENIGGRKEEKRGRQ